MAAEERRKQKEQIKILKQQVGLFFTCVPANLFTTLLSSSKSALTHIVPVFTAGNAEWLFCDALKLAFQLPSLLVVLKNYCCVFLHTNWNRVVGK